jgi:hypothetical protein
MPLVSKELVPCPVVEVYAAACPAPLLPPEPVEDRSALVPVQESVAPVEVPEVKVVQPIVDPAVEKLQNEKRQQFYTGFTTEFSPKFNKKYDGVFNQCCTHSASKKAVGCFKTALKVGCCLTMMFAKKGLGEDCGECGKEMIVDAGIDCICLPIENCMGNKEEVRKKTADRIDKYSQEVGGHERLPTHLADGLVYRFKDLIPHLEPGSVQVLSQHLAHKYADYIFNKPHEASNTYNLLIEGSMHKPAPKFLQKPAQENVTLRTIDGTALPMNELLNTTGVKTISGGEYRLKDDKKSTISGQIPKKSKDNIFIWGTEQEVEMLKGKGVALERVKQGVLKRGLPGESEDQEFWENAKELARKL